MMSNKEPTAATSLVPPLPNFKYGSMYTSSQNPSLWGGMDKMHYDGSPISPLSLHPSFFSDHKLISTDGYESLAEPFVQRNMYGGKFQPLNQSPPSQSYDCSREKQTSEPNETCSLYGGQSAEQILQELESSLMEPEDDERSVLASNSNSNACQVYSENLKGVGMVESQHFLLKAGKRAVGSFCGSSTLLTLLQSSGLRNRHPIEQLLLVCAALIADNALTLAADAIVKLKRMVSIDGDPIQRLAAYMAEGLTARLSSSGFVIYKALMCKEDLGSSGMTYRQKLNEICPYFKFGQLAAYGAIAEACKDEAKVHILELQMEHADQLLLLIKAFAGRPQGPPSVRITGVDDPDMSSSLVGVSLVGRRLEEFAKASGISSFEFCLVRARIAELRASMIEVHRPGEALAVNAAFRLHRLPDESVCLNNPRDRLLRLLKGMKPKILTLVEHEAHTNTAPFFQRFLETHSYYSAVLETIDSVLPGESKDRLNVEQRCIARDIVNIVACEGDERVERHELMGKWKVRLTMAGFESYPLSSHVNKTIKDLMAVYSEKYTLKEERGALYLGWLKRTLVVASAWH